MSAAILSTQDYSHLNNFFDLNKKVDLDNDEKHYLKDMLEECIELLGEHGEQGIPRIKEIVTDALLKDNAENLLKYLGLEIDDSIIKALEAKLNDESFLRVEETEGDKDFFNRYLTDDTINDLIMNLKGFDRKSEGSKEVFIKRRKALIPTARIGAIENILIAKFNKTNFLSEKEDVEQARLIMLAFTHIFDIVLEICYDCCDTQKTIEILGMISIKLSNLIGFSKGFRKELMETMRDSYNSDLNVRDNSMGNTAEE